MSVCKHCGFVGGWHYPWCIHPNPREPLTTRIEYFGRLQVHQPAKESPVSENEPKCACAECAEIDAFTFSVLLEQNNDEAAK